MAKPNGKPPVREAAPVPPWEIPNCEISLGGAVRKVSYPLPAMLRYQDASGVDVLNPPIAKADDNSGIVIIDWLIGKSSRHRADNMLLFLWAGLTTNEPSLTKEQVANWVIPSHIPQILSACLSAWAAAHVEGGENRPFVLEAVTEETSAKSENLTA